MKKILLLILLFSTTNIVLFAQTGKIAGIIKDATTGEELIGVNVILEGTMLGAATDVDGYFALLNITPGTYTLKASYIGYTSKTIKNLRVNIGQTTEANFNLNEEAITTEEVVVVAVTPIVKRGVASSGANLNAEEIKSLPVVNIASVVGLQAGVDGENIRGGKDDEVVYQVNGISMRDGRDNSSYNNLSMTSVKQIRVQSGGFTADVGDVRSGLVEVVTYEGDRNQYSFSFHGQYRPAANKHFGQSINDRNSYFIRPFVDDDVAWTGTNNGEWDKYLQRQYPQFEGWNAFAEGTLKNDNPDDDLTPEAAQRLFLWQYRKQFDITDPDIDMDMSFSGPVPVVSKTLGGLRFLASYKQNRTMLLAPLSTPDYKDYNYSLKLTSDLSTGMKLMVEGHFGKQMGTARSTRGGTGLFKKDWQLADRVDFGNYTNAVLFSDAYFTPSTVTRSSIAAKLTHIINPSTFYTVILSDFYSNYNAQPGKARDLTQKYKFSNNYFVDEAPFGYYQGASNALNGSNIRLGNIYSQSRDQSKASVYNFKVDLESQLNKYHNIKTGILFRLSDYNTHYGIRSELFSSSNRDFKWDTKPLLFAGYIQDKLEFEEMVATVGVRAEYSDPNSDWYVYSQYDKAFSSSGASTRDEVLLKEKILSQLTFMPRLGIAFPITVNSKLFLNYGHFQTLATPDNLYLIVEKPSGQITSIANPYAPLEKTITYEIGYEHNLFDQFLLRMTGYYKDISNQSKDIKYTGETVSYTRTEPIEYRDIRGFEIQLSKNRGEWITGFVNYTYLVTSKGKFGWGKYYESSVDQNKYIETEGQKWFKQNKPFPRPIARINIDIFTPIEFGPKIGSVYPLEGWRLNILSSWKSGNYKSWSGEKAVKANTQNNLQWLDYYNTNLRLSKVLDFGTFDIQVFAQVNNLFNTKRLSTTGFSHKNFDEDNYFKSLHLPSDIVTIKDHGYYNIPGDDRPGDYREDDVVYTPIEAVSDISTLENPVERLIYYDSATQGYFEYATASGWEEVNKSRMDQILKDKAYIDMPNFGFFTFLNPRNIFFGLKFNIKL